MTFKMVNICVQTKIPKCCEMCKKCKIVMHAKSSHFTGDVLKLTFFSFKNQAKTYQPFHKKQLI